VMVIQGIRRGQLLDNFRKTKRYWKLKEEVLVRSLWRTRHGRGSGFGMTDYVMNK
jgi:hypothetical protein